MSNRLALGTVQFGLPYGISNKSGQVSCDDATAILQAAMRGGMDTLDTAIAYGDSEQRLGDIGVGQWRVVSKLPPMPEGVVAQDWVAELVEGSLQRLRVPQLHGLMLHQSSLLLGPAGQEIYRAMSRLKNEGKVAKIGISIYSPDDLEAVLSRYALDIVQGPFNILDRRLLETGWLDRLHDSGTEIHVRSVFLQGLLLMKGSERPQSFQRWSPLWQQWDNWLAEVRLSPLAACLGFALVQANVDRVVVGVESPEQMNEIIYAASAVAHMPPDSLCCSDLDLINPSRWASL